MRRLSIGLGGGVFLFILIVIARPVVVAVSTLGSDLEWRERVFLAWIAPRGIVAAAVSSIFALRLTEAGYPQAERFVAATFLVIIGTVAVYSLTASTLARKLQLAPQNPRGVLIVGAHRSGDQALGVYTTEQSAPPRAGQTLISLVQPEKEQLRPKLAEPELGAAAELYSFPH